jgi:RNA polymerase-associated protein RTF1
MLIDPIGFKQGKPYSLEVPTTGKTFMTDQYALVAHGSAEKPWPFSACSDSKFSQSEFDRYVETLNKEHLRVPKKAWLIQKLDDIHKFLNVEWTEEALAGKFKRQREMQKRVDPANAAKVKREGIMKRKAEAEDAQDWEEASRCDAELAALENNAASSNGIALAARFSPLKAKPIMAESQQDRLALLNQKNRGKNANDVRQALIEERRKRERAIAEAKARAEIEAAEAARLAAEGSTKDGLLAVPGASKAMMRELFGDSPGTSRAGTPFSGTGTPGMRWSRAGTPMNGVDGGVKKKSALGLGAMNQEEEDVGIDLGIDVEI